MRGYSMYDNSPGVTSERPDPDLRVHPLAAPQGASPRHQLFTCERCAVARACLRNVIALRPFARPECNAAVNGQADTYAAPLRAPSRAQDTKQRVRAALKAAPGPIATTELAAALQLPTQKVNAALCDLIRYGEVTRVGKRNLGRLGGIVTLWQAVTTAEGETV